MSKAVLLSDNKEISDPEQAFILSSYYRDIDNSEITLWNSYMDLHGLPPVAK